MLLLAPVWMQIVHLLLADLLWISAILLAAQTLAAREEDPRDAIERAGIDFSAPRETSSGLD